MNISAVPPDSADHPFFAQRNLIFSLLGNISVFLIFLALPKLLLLVDENFDFSEFFMIAFTVSVALPFVTGFLTGFSVIKLFRIYYAAGNVMGRPIDSGIMSGYSQSQEQSKNWFVWLFASTSGMVNLIAFSLLLDLLRKLL